MFGEDRKIIMKTQNPTQDNKYYKFYDSHSNFINRTFIEYDISPGIKAKFDTIKSVIRNLSFSNALDVGCSGNSFIHFLEKIQHKSFCDIAQIPLHQYTRYPNYHPLVGSIDSFPYRSDSFDLLTALDVLEHIPDDKTACSEMARVLRPKGLMIVTVPHRKKYFTNQDIICGHVRRYEYQEIRDLFISNGLHEITQFGVYGQFMRIQFLQSANPEGTEQGLTSLRDTYTKNPVFHKFWDKLVHYSAKFMQLDARFQSFPKKMDICVIFSK
jgi:ubiquinone/menaquinone biosynthesis C-methylase UbiE